jgi:ferredoxin
MEYRDDDTSRFKSIAVIAENYCTGCGLCVGTCATLGIELQQLPTETLYHNGLLEAVRSKVAEQEEPVVVFTCERHANLGSLPESLQISQWEAGAGSSSVHLGSFDQAGVHSETVSSVLPCVGMVDVNWVKELNKSGAKDILLLGCPFDDCNYREGPAWETARLNRRKGLLTPNIQWREAGPGDARAIPEMMAVTVLPESEKEKPEIPHPKERVLKFPAVPAAAVVLILLSVITALALPFDIPSQSILAGESRLRVIVTHSGVISEALGSGNVSLPEESTIELSQILGGTRFPVGLQILVDGDVVYDEFYDPGGVRSEGEIQGMGMVTLAPGTYLVELRIDDDGEGWRTIFEDEVTLEPSQIGTYLFDQAADEFLFVDEFD